jgi:hypothetical protein
MNTPNQRQLIITKTKLKTAKSDAVYWRTQPYADRLAALEQIRQEYHQWNTMLSQDFKELRQKDGKFQFITLKPDKEVRSGR